MAYTTNPKEKQAMLEYMRKKALQAGFQANIVGNSVAIIMPFTYFGHETNYSIIHVSNIAEYRAIMGDD